MIGRMWRGWTSLENAAAYEGVLRAEVLPEIERLQGCRGAWVLRRAGAERVEYVTLILFDSVDAVRGFAGDDYETAVISPEARAVLADFEETTAHYDVVMAAGEFGPV